MGTIDVEGIAKLARLKMHSEEMKDFQNQFEKILEYFSRLQAIDTDSVEPLTTPFETYQNLREDKSKDYQEFSDEVIESSEHVKGRLFEVPPVVGGD